MRNNLAAYGIRDIVVSTQKFVESEIFGVLDEQPLSYHCRMRVNLARVANDGKKTTQLFFSNDKQLENLYENFSKFMGNKKYLKHEASGKYRIDDGLNSRLTKL